MTGYWIRHRLLLTIIISFIVAGITSLLFVYSHILKLSNDYNSQSIYKKTDIDFIVPEPSFEQVDALPGTHGIGKVFPYYLTKTQVSVNGKTRTTTVLLSDQFQNIDITMYNATRLIKGSDVDYKNPIMVDWQFCNDTSAGIGDTVSIAVGDENKEYKISSIYETNSIYAGGAILAQISEKEKDDIAQQSSNKGYSGMYVSASDYNTCRSYLTTEYRPLGRLKDRSQFKDDDQYQVHYDAIMSSGYANEITDFRIREDSLKRYSVPLMPWIGAVFAFASLIIFNLIMSRRGCENVYFRKQCIPKGKNVKPYYRISFLFEMCFSLVFFVILLLLRSQLSGEFIPRTALGIGIVAVPIGIVMAEILSLIMNNSKVSGMIQQFEQEKRKGKDQEAKDMNHVL